MRSASNSLMRRCSFESEGHGLRTLVHKLMRQTPMVLAALRIGLMKKHSMCSSDLGDRTEGRACPEALNGHMWPPTAFVSASRSAWVDDRRSLRSPNRSFARLAIRRMARAYRPGLFEHVPENLVAPAWYP